MSRGSWALRAWRSRCASLSRKSTLTPFQASGSWTARIGVGSRWLGVPSPRPHGTTSSRRSCQSGGAGGSSRTCRSFSPGLSTRCMRTCSTLRGQGRATWSAASTPATPAPTRAKKNGSPCAVAAPWSSAASARTSRRPSRCSPGEGWRAPCRLPAAPLPSPCSRSQCSVSTFSTPTCVHRDGTQGAVPPRRRTARAGIESIAGALSTLDPCRVCQRVLDARSVPRARVGHAAAGSCRGCGCLLGGALWTRRLQLAPPPLSLFGVHSPSLSLLFVATSSPPSHPMLLLPAARLLPAASLASRRQSCPPFRRRSQIRSIEDAIDELTRVEQVHGYRPAGSSAPTTAKKTVRFERLPPLLVLQVVRYNFEEDAGTVKVRKGRRAPALLVPVTTQTPAGGFLPLLLFLPTPAPFPPSVRDHHTAPRPRLEPFFSLFSHRAAIAASPDLQPPPLVPSIDCADCSEDRHPGEAQGQEQVVGQGVPGSRCRVHPASDRDPPRRARRQRTLHRQRAPTVREVRPLLSDPRRAARGGGVGGEVIEA